MNLWIRSQDKTKLSKVIDIYVVGYEDDWAIGGYCINGCDDFDLGVYSSKERALEVLDEITAIIRFKEASRLSSRNEILPLLKEKFDDKQIDYIVNQMNVYEMPLE